MFHLLVTGIPLACLGKHSNPNDFPGLRTLAQFHMMSTAKLSTAMNSLPMSTSARNTHLALVQVGRVDQLDQFRIEQATTGNVQSHHLAP